MGKPFSFSFLFKWRVCEQAIPLERAKAIKQFYCNASQIERRLSFPEASSEFECASFGLILTIATWLSILILSGSCSSPSSSHLVSSPLTLRLHPNLASRSHWKSFEFKMPLTPLVATSCCVHRLNRIRKGFACCLCASLKEVAVSRWKLLLAPCWVSAWSSSIET